MMVWDYINQIQQAHQSGDLKDEEQLKMALQYQNKHNTQSIYPFICDRLQTYSLCHEIKENEDSPSSPLYGNAEGRTLINECRQQAHSQSKTNGTTLKCIMKFDQLAGKTGIAISPRLLASTNQAIRTSYFKPAWDEYQQKCAGRLLWLSEPHIPAEPIHSTAQKLGLYHWRQIQQGELILSLTVRANDIYKPTLLDAGMAFYFDASPGYLHHGYTRDLATGQQGYKEWVSYFDALLELDDVQLLTMQTDINLGEFTQEFILFSAEQIENARS
ncbi:hypothetical protein [Methylomonas sp. MgM2]